MCFRVAVQSCNRNASITPPTSLSSSAKRRLHARLGTSEGCGGTLVFGDRRMVSHADGAGCVSTVVDAAAGPFPLAQGSGST